MRTSFAIAVSPEGLVAGFFAIAVSPEGLVAGFFAIAVSPEGVEAGTEGNNSPGLNVVSR
jgi:ABC-type phosphate/phosphonate transport system permease subunit